MMTDERKRASVVGYDTIQYLIPVIMSIIGINDLRTDGDFTVSPCLAPVLDLTSHMNRRAVGEIVASKWCHPGRKEIRMHMARFRICPKISL